MERYRTTLIMAAALLILAGLAFFLTSKNTTTVTGTPTTTPVVSIWQDANPVKALDIVSGTSKVSLAEDATGSWLITQPISAPADVFQVGSVADSLQNLQAEFALSGTTDLTQYGLAAAPMQVTATFSDTQSTQRVLQVGYATTDGSGYYVKTPADSKVYVVTNTTLEPLRSWLTTPPILQPTATPVPITPVTETPTPTETETPGPTSPATNTPAAGALTSTPAAATNTPLASLSPTP